MPDKNIEGMTSLLKNRSGVRPPWLFPIAVGEPGVLRAGACPPCRAFRRPDASYFMQLITTRPKDEAYLAHLVTREDHFIKLRELAERFEVVVRSIPSFDP